VDDDDGPGQELVHGSREVHSLAALPGGVANPTLYRLAQRAGASYEVAVDGASGDVSPVVIERLASDQSTVLQAGLATGVGSASMRWENRSGAVDTQWIRVRSGGCTTGCGADDLYRIRAYETTGSLPRFVASATQSTIVILQNRGTQTITGNVDFWGPAGTALGTRAFTLAPAASLAFDAAGVPGVAGQSGSATVTHDGGYGDLVGKSVALEPATGFAFDTTLVLRPR